MLSDSERDQLLAEVEDLDNVLGVAKMGPKARPCAVVRTKVDEEDLDDDQIVANNVSRSTGVMEIGDTRFQKYQDIGVGMPTAHADRHERHRPPLAGLSSTNVNSTACTLTGIAEVTDLEAPGIVRSDDVSEGDYVYAYNCHCAARGGDADFASPVVQPSPYDGGNATDSIGEFCGYVPLEDGAQTDYSEATISNPEQASTKIHGLDDSYGKGAKRESYESLIGTELTNSGRTVGVRSSIVRAVGVSVRVGYGDGESIRMDNAIITKPPQGEPTMSQGGQSGAPVFSEAEGRDQVGVLYAGSNVATILATLKQTEDAAGVRYLRSDESLDLGVDEPDMPEQPRLTLWERLKRLFQAEVYASGGQS